LLDDAPHKRSAARKAIGVQNTAMRVIDVVVSTCALLALSPLLLALAVALRATSGSSVLFRDERAGRGGKPFTLFKFRTMRPPVPGERSPDDDMARLTPLGRRMRSLSLDELPTFWSVLRGEMALVGPRPLPVRYVDRYSPRQARRLEVRPGITGWAQINGRNALSWDDRFELDVWYVEHRSLGLDLRILGRTALTVLRREGISHAGHATMPEFKGPADP
jgi:lipopolysaccharide/colanic/teichoic acid biosynthesis glycosyltransferase